MVVRGGGGGVSQVVRGGAWWCVVVVRGVGGVGDAKCVLCVVADSHRHTRQMLGHNETSILIRLKVARRNTPERPIAGHACPPRQGVRHR